MDHSNYVSLYTCKLTDYENIDRAVMVQVRLILYGCKIEDEEDLAGQSILSTIKWYVHNH
jgi:hypothetical protein